SRPQCPARPHRIARPRAWRPPPPAPSPGARRRAEGRSQTRAPSRSWRRRSRSGRALVTYGTSSKLCGGGGEVVYHSSVSASQGSLTARTPERDVFNTFTANTSTPSPITPEPIVEVRLYHSQKPP